jgi:hypothetical protein
VDCLEDLEDEEYKENAEDDFYKSRIFE